MSQASEASEASEASRRTSHLVKFPRACHTSPALTEKQVTQLVRRRKLAQHAGAWSSLQVLKNYVKRERHYTDNDLLFTDEKNHTPYNPTAENDELVPIIPRLLPPDCYIFDETTYPTWQADITQRVIPALLDAPGIGMYGYVVHVSSPFLPACVVGCACEKGNRACHFIVVNKDDCTVSDIQVPKGTPLYMCAAGCVIVGPTHSISPPMYRDDSGKLLCVVDKQWVRIASKGLNPYKARFERFGVGPMRGMWESVSHFDVDPDSFAEKVLATHMDTPFVHEAVHNYAKCHPEVDENVLRHKILSKMITIVGKTIVVKIRDTEIRGVVLPTHTQPTYIGNST